MPVFPETGLLLTAESPAVTFGKPCFVEKSISVRNFSPSLGTLLYEISARGVKETG
jgi:hypothetical protein